jgi:hypothetical protein
MRMGKPLTPAGLGRKCCSLLSPAVVGKFDAGRPGPQKLLSGCGSFLDASQPGLKKLLSGCSSVPDASQPGLKKLRPKVCPNLLHKGFG